MDEKVMAACFNEWLDRYTNNPDSFRHMWQDIQEHLAEHAEGKEPSYGSVCAAYMERLSSELPAATK